jgi:uncharacterized protein YhfF
MPDASRSTDFWLRCAELGRSAREDMPVILERFDLVYPVAR